MTSKAPFSSKLKKDIEKLELIQRKMTSMVKDQ